VFFFLRKEICFGNLNEKHVFFRTKSFLHINSRPDECSIQRSKHDNIICGKMLGFDEIPGATNPAQLSNRQQQVIYGEMLEPTKSQNQKRNFSSNKLSSD